MKRFPMLIAIAAVAGAMYVAAAPGSLRATGPTAKQFAALKKQVTKLQKQVKTVQGDADFAAGFVLECVAHQPVAVDSVGTSTDGYLFGAPGTTPNEATTALNLAPTTEATPQYRFYTVNASDSSCVSIINSAASHAGAAAHIAAFARH